MLQGLPDRCVGHNSWLHCFIRRTFGNSINKGETIIPFIENKEKLMEICDAALNFFAENAKPSERFKFTIDRVGREKFEQRILEVYNG